MAGGVALSVDVDVLALPTTGRQQREVVSVAGDSVFGSINFDVGAVTALKKWLSFQLTASDRYLSTPVGGRKRNDVLLTTGFRVSFAR